jgi:predicted nucleic acid-binding protein
MNQEISKALLGAREAVIDASLTFDALLGDPDRRALATAFLEASGTEGVLLIAPPAFTGEIDTAVRQAVHRRGLPESALPAVYGALDALPVSVTLDENELRLIRLRARVLAATLGQPSVYDCTYAALAEKRRCDFWTADKRFYNASRSTLSFVKFVGNY